MTLKEFDYVLAPYGYHATLLALRQGQWDESYTLLTKVQFLKDVQFEIDEHRAVALLFEHEHIPPSLAATYLNELTFVPPVSDHPKVKLLRKYFELLDHHGAIKRNPLGAIKYKHKKIYVMGYAQEDAALNQWFHSLGVKATCAPQPKPSDTLEVGLYRSVADEVSGFMNAVSHLHNQGVAWKDIKLFRPPEAYHYELQRQAAYYHVPLENLTQQTMALRPLVIHALASEDIEAFVNLHGNEYPLEDVQFLQSVLKKTPDTFINSPYQHEYIRWVCEQHRSPRPRQSESIRLVNEGVFLDHQYVFILGFAQGNMPKVERDIGYLSDDIRHSLGLDTSRIRNEQSRLSLEQVLAHPGKVYLSRAEMVQGASTLPSPLVDTLGIKETPMFYAHLGHDYGYELGLIRKKLYDELKTYYQIEHPYLASLTATFPQKPERFHYAFKGLDVPNKDHVRLSYSAVNTYFHCGFKYYVERVLHVEPYQQDRFHMHLGTFAHAVFEHLKGDLSQFDTVFEQQLEIADDLTPKERILFRHLQSKLKEVATFNDLHQKAMQNPSFHEELEVVMEVDDHTTMKGYIDRAVIVQPHAEKAYVALMDYKSGSESFDKKLVDYGWSLQLPIYALMMDYHPQLKGKPLLGVFIQHIIDKKMNSEKLDINQQRFPKHYQLDGVAVEDPERLFAFDASLRKGKSLFISGITPVSTGFKKSKNVISEGEMQRLQATAKLKIQEASEKIRRHEFPINPIHINSSHDSCTYCPFKDVCFRHQSDVRMVKLDSETEAENESN